jgi:hypothetical protein
MPYSSGTYSLPSGNPVVTGTTISSSTTNTTNSDIATALSSCILKDGTQTVTANIPMAGHKFTGLSAPTTAGDSLSYNSALGTPASGVATNLTGLPLTTGVTGTLPVANGGTGLTSVPHTVQVFTSGSGTYTLPTNCKAIKVTMVGGGGGGGGGGQGGPGGGTGGTSTFGTSFLTCFGGVGGNTPPAGGGATQPTGGDINLYGSGGVQGADFRGASQFCPGGTGGYSILGGAGTGGYVTVGSNSATGSGGGGGGISAAQFTGGGGAAGGALYKLISSPSATYSYAIGAGGTGGAAGTSGFAGGTGGSGVIIVEEYYV